MIARATEWTLDVLGRLPTTNARIATSIAAFIAAIVVWLLLAIVHSFFPSVAAWEPSGTMIAFLSVWGGLDVLQFGAKRMTHRNGATESPKPGAT